MAEQPPAAQQQFKIAFPPELQGGVYANNMVVQHTQEEFLMDFMLAAPPAGAVVARVVVSPGHMKRILQALEENLRKYESSYGQIRIAQEPPGRIGF